MKINYCAIAVLSSFALVNVAYSQLAITSNIQSTTITFGENLGWEDATPTDNPDTSNDVFRRTNTGGELPAGNSRFLLETTQFSTATSDFGPSSRAFSVGASGLDFDSGGPMVSGQSTFFGDDFNGDGDTTDNLGVVAGATILDSTNAYGVSLDGVDRAISFGTNGAIGTANYLRPYRDYAFTLRIQNVSGIEISEWSTSLDAWWGDEDSANATMSLRWSTDLTNWNTLDSFTTFDAGDANQLLTRRDFGPIAFSANVADGSYLYLQVTNLRAGAVAAADGGVMTSGSGSGAALVIDNWNVTAIPEPSTVTFFASALAGLGYLFFRRHGK